MGGRNKRRSRRAKNQRARARRSPTNEDIQSADQLMLTETFDLFARYVRSATSREEAAAAAQADMRAAAERISQLAAGRDLIRVVSSVRVAMIMDRIMTDIEMSGAALELIALALAYRDSAELPTAEAPSNGGFMPPDIQVAAQQCLTAGSMIALFDNMVSDAEQAILFFSIQREIALRNPIYPHMLLDTLRGLFSDPSVNDKCKTVLGFTGLEAVNVMEAVRVTANLELAKRFERMEAARDASIPYLMSWRKGMDAMPDELSEEHRAVAQDMFDAVQDLTTNISHSTEIDPDAIARHAKCDRSAVDAVLQAFTLGDLPNLDDALDRFFRGDNPLRTAPIIADRQGRRMLVHDALALPAIREVIEVGLKAAAAQDVYEKHRGTWVESYAVDLFAKALKTGRVYRGFNYFVPDPKAADPQVNPEQFTKRVEADGLILVDDVALVIEVKSVALTAEARGGVARRLRGKLRDIVTNAASQADRLRTRILNDELIRLDSGQSIDVSGIREIHTIAVGLEDLSGVTTATAALVSAGVIDQDSIPWTVSLHDLRIVCELLERPSELLLYLRRRTELATTWKYRAVDELDLFLHFLDQGLYVEPDPHQTALALPWTGSPAPGALRRFASQKPEIVASRTDSLDAWYDTQLDPEAPEAEKPRINANERLLELVDQISATGAAGWLSTATALLEGNAKVQRTFGRHAADLAKLVRRDRQHHSLTYIMIETSGKQILLAWACHGLDEDADTAVSYLMPYLQAKKHQTGFYRAALMLFDPTGKQLVRLLFDNQPARSDPSLDESASHLLPLTEMRRTIAPRLRSLKKGS
jgi:hypothetical protein